LFSGRDCRHSALRNGGYSEISGKVIEGPKRYDPEWNVASGKHARNGSHAPVSTTDDDCIEFPVDDLLPGSLSRWSQL
jgi:hypothetical protein